MSAQVLLHERAHKKDCVPPVVDALQAHLRSLRDLIAGLNCDMYCATPSRTSGSVGEHVRHCLDHARALFSAASNGELTYDSRLRGTRIETDPDLAVDEIDRLSLDLEDLDERALGRPVYLQSMTHRDGPPTRVATTTGREVAFIIQHTIHHCAIVAILLDHLGVAVPERFGYAPSTPARG